jgi:hypothetical protein
MQLQLAFVSFLALVLVSPPSRAQKIETQTPDRNRITRLETALDHLSVIEVEDAVEQVAAGSPAFKIEWRGNKVFVQPLEADAATNLFIWTRGGDRLSYELVAAGPVERMHFAIDHESPAPPTVAATAPPPAPPSLVPDAGTILKESTPVATVGHEAPRKKISVLLRDVFEQDGRVYVRYAVQNRGSQLYQPGAPLVVHLVSPKSPQSLYSVRRMQLADSAAEKLSARGLQRLKLVNELAPTTAIAPGSQTIGVIGFERPVSAGPTVVRFEFRPDGQQSVAATLVL